ncbi:MAG: glycogen synthase GlgA [Bryobacteraceae bacterium]
MTRILMASSEAAPFAKTGGLADVLGALPGALNRLGNEAAVVLPRYRSISLDQARRVYDDMPLALGSGTISCSIWRQDRSGVPFFFVDCPRLYDREGLYSAYGHDFADNHIRFAALSLAALGVLRHLFPAEVLHLHDWQSALAAAYLRTRFRLDPHLMGTKIVFTIHNLEHQGRFAPFQFGDLSLDRSLMQPHLLEFYGDVSFMKAGLVYSDAVTTVSPTYAREIQTAEFGCGLDGLLRANASKLSGILNGVDYADWNPETDPHIAAHYTAANPGGKAVCKEALIREAGLPASTMKRPLLGIVSRFAGQKGFDIFAEVAFELFSADDAALAFIGSGEARFEEMFKHLMASFPDRVWGRFGYDNALAHRIEAGADLFLMPSLFEPCGLNQMYSLRYGTIPVVRATGGLDDTVDGDTGFKFWGYAPRDLLIAIRTALAEHRDREAWAKRMRAGMSRDFSWDASARKYSDLYGRLISRG